MNEILLQNMSAAKNTYLYRVQCESDSVDSHEHTDYMLSPWHHPYKDIDRMYGCMFCPLSQWGGIRMLKQNNAR